MDSATRMQVMNEAQKFLTSRGVDAASFKSQYTALNDVLERSIRIMGNVQRDEMEISGTIDNLSDIASESEL
jgi:hypothetical protein